MLAIANSKELLASEITSKHLGLIDVFTLFPSCKPSMSALLQAATRIMPKYYTIASSSVKFPDQIKIAISLTKNDGHYG
jgi:methionine synthase reductase